MVTALARIPRKHRNPKPQHRQILAMALRAEHATLGLLRLKRLEPPASVVELRVALDTVGHHAVAARSRLARFGWVMVPVETVGAGVGLRCLHGRHPLVQLPFNRLGQRRHWPARILAALLHEPLAVLVEILIRGHIIFGLFGLVC